MRGVSFQGWKSFALRKYSDVFDYVNDVDGRELLRAWAEGNGRSGVLIRGVKGRNDTAIASVDCS